MYDNRGRDIFKNLGYLHVDWGCLGEHLKEAVFQINNFL